MHKFRPFNFIVISLISLILLPTAVHAKDVVRLVTPLSGGDKTVAYKRTVLKRALELSKDQFGEYEMIVSRLTMKPRRALVSMKQGEAINVAVFAAEERRDEELIPIRVPIRGGMLSYRLLFVHQDNLANFEKVNTSNELRQLTAGLQHDWATTTTMLADNFNAAVVNYFDGAFEMLCNRRVDYIPRAIYEAYDELAYLSELDSNIVIDPSIALYIPMVSYVYVSPKEERLAKRLELGLKRLSKTGELKRIFSEFYQTELARLKLDQRTTVNVHDDYFASQLPQLSKEMLWSLDSFDDLEIEMDEPATK